VRALAILALCKIAVHAEDLETGRITFTFQPCVKFHATASKLFLLPISAAIDVIDGQKAVRFSSRRFSRWFAS